MNSQIMNDKMRNVTIHKRYRATGLFDNFWQELNCYDLHGVPR